MNTRILATALVVIATAGVLSGCKAQVVTSSATQELGTVTAAGAGTVPAAPDQAVMSFGVTKRNADAKAALDSASKAAQEITDAIKNSGIADEDIQTRDVSVYPLTTQSGGRPRITGYQASLSVSTTVRDLSKLGETITVATDAGADTVNGPNFTIDDDASYREDAIAEAVEDAKRSAQAMAKAAGKDVGEVLRISASDTFFQPLGFEAAELRAADAASVPIEPGTLDVFANVTVVFELK